MLQQPTMLKSSWLVKFGKSSHVKDVEQVQTNLCLLNSSTGSKAPDPGSENMSIGATS